MSKKNKKNVQILMAIMIVAMIPGLWSLFNSNAFSMVKDVNIVLLYVSGMGAGALLITLLDYFKR